jgi:AcrR family transcriptional regulator
MDRRLNTRSRRRRRGTKRRQVRIEPEERYREFVQKAVELFSEVGFEAGTRELAQRLGVTQPLLYRYFPSKDDLIAAVYREIYVERWDPAWERTIADTSRPLRERLQAFYDDYTDKIFTPEWLRIYLFAGLRGVDINSRYFANVEASILTPIAKGLRMEAGVVSEAPISPEELELVWSLHGGIFYYGVRTLVYGFACPIGRSQMIANALDAYLEGAPKVLRRLPDRAPTPAAKLSGPSSRRQS